MSYKKVIKSIEKLEKEAGAPLIDILRALLSAKALKNIPPGGLNLAESLVDQWSIKRDLRSNPKMNVEPTYFIEVLNSENKLEEDLGTVWLHFKYNQGNYEFTGLEFNCIINKKEYNTQTAKRMLRR